MQPESLKLTIKQNRKISVTNSLTNVEGEVSPSNDDKVHDSPTNNSQQKGVLANCSTVDEEKPSEISQYQLVISNPCSNSFAEIDTVSNPDRTLSSIRQHPKVYPSVKAFTVQCANCYKWRIIPTQEKYEEIREHILEVPFFCKTGQEWQPDLSCDDPPDITQEGGRNWAIDKPNISLPPPGWQRLLKFRCEGSSKFADVYYISSLGKKLRSMADVASYLIKHPEYAEQGVDISQFSFRTPKRMLDDSLPTRPAIAEPKSDVLPSEDQPLSGTSHNVETDLHLSSPGHSVSFGSSQLSKKKKRGRPKKCAGPSLSLETHVPKKQKSLTIRRCSSSWFKS